MTDRALPDMGLQVHWNAFDNGLSVGQEGSAGGHVIRDEEYAQMARITLEQGCRTAAYAITCGIQGWMVHTRLFDSGDIAAAQFEEMKQALAEIVEDLPFQDEAGEDAIQVLTNHLRRFTERFP